MDTKIIPRSDADQASIVRQGIEWYRTYGQRSAAAFLAHRHIPRAVIERVFVAARRRREDEAA
jgi:hypothetical protein